MNILSSTISKLSRREKTIFGVALGVAALSLFLLAGDYFLKHSQAKPAEGGTYREAMVGQPSMLNPILAENQVDADINRLIFLPLSDLADQIAPDASGGLKTWRVRLKQNLLWQDGQKVTADDVIFTLEKMQDPSELSPLFNRWQYIQAKRLSELEILFTLPSQYSFFGEYLNGLTPIPKHLWADMPLTNWHLSPLILKPVGNGPYEFEKMGQQTNGFIDSYTLAKSKKYSGAKSKIDKIRFSFFHSNPEAIQEFNRGSVDGWWAENPDQLVNLSRPHQTKTFGLPKYYAVFMNASKNNSLADKPFRQLLAKAIDTGDISAEIFKETAKPIKSLSQIIDKDGYSDSETGSNQNSAMSADSVSVSTSSQAANGDGVNLTLTASNLPQDNQLAKDLISTWNKYGIKVRLVSKSPKELAQETVPDRDYQLLLYSQNMFPTKDLSPFWHSRERFAPGQNLSLYANQKLDSLLDAMRTSNSSSSRETALTEAIKTIDNDQPTIFIAARTGIYVLARNVGGVSEDNLEISTDRFQQVYNWYLETTLVWKR